MRRLQSILVLLFLIAGPLWNAIPALASGPNSAVNGQLIESRLPACCRRHGAHHCAAELPTRGERSFRSPSGCPSWPAAPAQSPGSFAALAEAATSAAPRSASPCQSLSSHLPRLHALEHPSQRGPPSALIL